MTPLKEFQIAHGREWAGIATSGPFAAALALSQSEKIRKILALSDDEIQRNGAVILADLRGFLQYESGLLGLHEKKEFVFQDIGAETYPDPIEEAREEDVEHQQEETGIKPDPETALTQQLFPQKKNLPTPRKTSRKSNKVKP